MMSETKVSLPAPLALVIDETHSKLTSAVSLTLPTDTSFEAWTECGQVIAKAAQSVQWWSGDWWAHGATHYGQRRYQFSALGCALNYRTFENYASVCRRFETSRRREVLSFSHHQAVASLPAAEADRLLDWAEATIPGDGHPRSVRELREEVQRRRPEVETQGPSSTSIQGPSVASVQGPSAASVAGMLSSGLQSTLQTIASEDALDASKGGASIFPEPAALREPPAEAEPRTLTDADIAAKSLAACAFDDALAVVIGWKENLTPEERSAARDVLFPPIRRPHS